MINQIYSSKVSFGSVKPSLRLGEEVVREFKREFPNINSPSLTAIRAYTLNNRLKNEDLIKRLNKKSMSDYDYFTEKVRNNVYFTGVDSCVKTLIDFLKKFNILNCGEINLIAQQRILKKGVKADMAAFSIKNKLPLDKSRHGRLCGDHDFIVLNLAKDAKINEPESWGNKAVIVDAFFNRVGLAADMLEEYKQKFRLDEDLEKFEFKGKNMFDVVKYLEDQKALVNKS